VGSCDLLHRSLTLQGNSLSGTLPSGLFAMPDLEYVSALPLWLRPISRNRCSPCLSDVIAWHSIAQPPPTLKHFAAFAHVPALRRVLDVSHNAITGVIPSALQGAGSLEYVQQRGCFPCAPPLRTCTCFLHPQRR
jgi:hypothetical protein